MLEKPINTASLIFVFLTSNCALAQGLLYELPKDGAWVRYEMTAAGISYCTLTLRSVGKSEVNGKPCRWIEGETDRRVGKFLLPEEYIGTEQPLAHAVRAYQRGGSGPIEKTEHPKHSEFWGLVLSGPSKDAKKLSKTEELKWKGGTLVCDVHESRETIEDLVARLGVAHRVLTHRDVPFGVASHRCDCEVLESRVMGAVILPTPFILCLVDMGENAKSSLPESK